MFGKGGKARQGGNGNGGGDGTGIGGQGASGAGGSDFDGLVLDESFVKAAMVKEESARTRQLREQWKKEPPKAQPWRTHEGDALQHRMAGRAASAAGMPAPKRRKFRALRRSIALIVVLGLIAGGYEFYSHRSIVTAAGVPQINPSLTAMPSAAGIKATVTPTGSCYAGLPGCGSPSQPYAGSPALTWADGADGIVLPAAVRTADFSAAQVAAALALSKQFMIDQTMVPDVLVGGAKPTAMMGLISDSDSYGATLANWLASPTADDDPTWLFVRFDPKTSALLTTPKVSGTITYAQAKAGILAVTLSFKVVYALQKPDKTVWTRTMASVDDDLWFYNGTAHYAPTTGKVWPEQAGMDGYAGTDCGSKAGFLEPFYELEHVGDGSPGGAVVDPYATSTAGAAPTPTSTGLACGAVSRL